MNNFQKKRIEFILNKEKELTKREQNVLSMEDCNDNLNKYKELINKINTDLTKNNDDLNILTKYVQSINLNLNKDLIRLHSLNIKENTIEPNMQSK